MEFVDKFKDKSDEYTKKINDSKYIENIINHKNEKGYDDICEIYLIKYDLNYQLMSDNEKMNYLIKKKMEIASDINNYNYNKKININLISNGLQKKNQYSSILYLNDYYKCNLIIYNSNLNKYYKSGLKDNEGIGCIYKNNQWFPYDDIKDINEYGDHNELDHIITFDISTNCIYNYYLKNISKYKVDDLILICEGLNINIMKDNKKKLKKELYDEINLKKMNES